MNARKTPIGSAKPRRQDITPEARRALDRIERESEALGTSSMARTANKTVRDMRSGAQSGTGAGAGAGAEDDGIEIWGKRIGRGLAIIAIAWLVYHLAITYILPGLSG